MASVTCYNSGCGNGARFIEAENTEDACQHHPGAPIFHEGYKGWSCCKKRSIDFTEFLNIPGCTKGRHNPIKPPPPEKPVVDDHDIDGVIDAVPKMMKNKAPDVILERPSDDLPKAKLKTIISGSLKTGLEQHRQRMLEVQAASDAISDEIQPGASCKHNACDAKYVSDDSSNISCVYHPGYPVFHEGYKFWSCCDKRTSDFDEFLKQSGCETGRHDWMKPSDVLLKKATCRYDWHQTGKFSIISIYSKICDPDKCYVEVNPTSVHAYIAFNGGTDVFELELILNGVIDPEGSSVEYMKTKAEIKLKKRDPFSWPRLEYKAE